MDPENYLQGAYSICMKPLLERLILFWNAILHWVRVELGLGIVGQRGVVSLGQDSGIKFCEQH